MLVCKLVFSKELFINYSKQFWGISYSLPIPFVTLLCFKAISLTWQPRKNPSPLLGLSRSTNFVTQFLVISGHNEKCNILDFVSQRRPLEKCSLTGWPIKKCSSQHRPLASIAAFLELLKSQQVKGIILKK